MRPQRMSVGSELAKVVERQMRNWELARAQRVAEPQPPPAACDVASFITISRTVGAGGGEVAALLGQRLNWPVFDREILQAMAGNDELRARLYEHMDERDVTWLENTVRWLLRGEFRRDDYFGRLTETVLALARQSNSIFLGRGADLILPRERGLCVRIVAPLPYRARVFAKRHQMSEAQALAEIERIDRGREEFLHRHFGAAATDSGRYDLTINTERMSAADAAELLLAALRLRKLLPE